jgi:hypothetical protein
VIPLVDCGLLVLRERDLFAAGDDDRVDLFARFCEADRLLAVRRVGGRALRLVDPDRRAARRVLVWVMSEPPSKGCFGPCLGYRMIYPTLRSSEPKVIIDVGECGYCQEFAGEAVVGEDLAAVSSVVHLHSLGRLKRAPGPTKGRALRAAPRRLADCPSVRC